jgi:hypothetical protein
MPLLLLAEPGYGFENINPNPNYGVHGYDPNFRNMSALFVARGPVFKKGYVSSLPINNIDLVPLFAKIMDIPDVPSNGTVERVALLLEDNFQPSSTVSPSTVSQSTMLPTTMSQSTVSQSTVSPSTSTDGNSGMYNAKGNTGMISVFIVISLILSK